MHQEQFKQCMADIRAKGTATRDDMIFLAEELDDNQIRELIHMLVVDLELEAHKIPIQLKQRNVGAMMRSLKKRMQLKTMQRSAQPVFMAPPVAVSE